MARIRKFRASSVKWYWKPLLYFYPHGNARSVPIGIAVAHNAVGALLLLSMVTLVHTASRRRL